MEQIERLADTPASAENPRNMIPFYDDKGILKFSIKKENLLYLESAENYVNICYLNKGKVSKYLLRDTLKKIEENFKAFSLWEYHQWQTSRSDREYATIDFIL